MDSYSVQAVLSAVDRGFTSTMRGAVDTVGALDGAAQRSKTSIMRIAAGIGVFKLLNKAVSTVTSSIGSAISRFDTLNNYPKVMTALGYSTEDATSSIRKLSTGIEGLPTTLDGIAQSAQTLTASFGDLGRGTDVAIALNDMFLAGGQGAEAASRALVQFNQMVAKGKVDMQSWNTVVQTAPGQMAQLAHELIGASATQRDLYEALQTGKLSMDDFTDAIIRLDKEGGKSFESFADQARSATGGIKTAMTNLRSAVTRGLANTITSIDAALENSGLPKIADALNSAKGTINGFFGAINGGIRGMKDLQGTAKGAAAVIASAFAAATLPFGGWVKLLPTIVSGLGLIQRNFGPQIEEMAQIAIDKGPGIILGLVGGITSQLPLLMRQGAILISTLADVIVANLPLIVYSAILIIETLGESFAENADILLSSAALIISALATSILNNAPKLLQTGLDLLKSLVEGLTTNSEVRNSASEILSTLVIAIVEMATMLIQDGPVIIAQLVQGIVNALPAIIQAGIEILNGLINAIIENMPILLDAAVQIITALTQGIVDNLPMILDAGLEMIKAIGQGIIDNLPEILSAAGEIMATLISGIDAVITQLLTKGWEILTELANGITNAKEQARSAIAEVIRGVISKIGEKLSDILEKGREIVDKIATGIRNKISAATSAITAVWTNIKNKFTGLISSAINWGRDLVNGIASGIRNAIGNVTSAASSVAGSISSLLHFSRPDRGPLREYEQWMPDMMKGIARGITDNLSLVQDAAWQVADIIAGAQEPFGGKLAYSAAIGGDVTYGADIEALAARPIVVDNSIWMDGRELAKGSTSYIQTQMASNEKLQSYIRGVR